MYRKNIYIFVEGPRDKTFTCRIIKPKIRRKYSEVHIIQYKKLKKERILNYIKSINENNDDYYFLSDSDISKSECISDKKQKFNEIFESLLDLGAIIIVIKEIDSWYRAGMPGEIEEKINLAEIRNTDNITKRKFERMRPSGYSMEEFLDIILKKYSFEDAIRRSDSFAYLYRRIILP